MQAVSSSVISSRVLITRARCISCWPSTTSMPARLQREHHRRLDHVHAQRLAQQPARLQLAPHLVGHVLGPAALGRHRPAHGRDAGRACGPRATGSSSSWWRAAEPKSHTIGSAPRAEQREAGELVHRPRADVGGGDVADVRHVEAEQRSQLGLAPAAPLMRVEPLAPQPVDVDPLLPVDGVQPERRSHLSYLSARPVRSRLARDAAIASRRPGRNASSSGGL